MKEVWQEMKTGRTLVAEVPAPIAGPGRVLIQVHASAVSAGTERMVVEFASRSMLAKARSRPDLVKQVISKARREGILTAYEAVQRKLDEPMALGYSVAGIVVDVGAGVTDFAAGDHVAAAGGGYAVHAEVVSVPNNLVAKLPDGVDFDAAAFTTLGAIALHGVRLADVKLGEYVAVLGLGLLGQITTQLLHASGCRVIGFDPRVDRADLALRCGATAAASSEAAFEDLCRMHSGGGGADAVLITADTSSHAPLALAGRVSRDRGVVVAVGAVGMQIPRKAYFEKELDFRISRSYGPGRYDTTYEEEGHDYPIGYVRWTEQRNLQAVVELLASQRIDVAPLISHRFAIEDAEGAYELISGKTAEPFLGVVLAYSGRPEALESTMSIGGKGAAAAICPGAVSVGLLGAGNFANATLLPAMKKDPGTHLAGVCAASARSAKRTGDRFGFKYATTDPAQVLADPNVTAVVITTRHNLHAEQTMAALDAGKHVFVEKPLCLSDAELDGIRAAHARAGRHLMVGFNRRFAPFARRVKSFFAEVQEPLMIEYRANAGVLPPDHWTQNPEIGGGRIVGEAIHFIDLASWLAGCHAVTVAAEQLPNAGRYRDDNVAISLTFANGSLARILYVANGDTAAGKERLEVHGGQRTAILDDYRRLDLFGGGRRESAKTWLRQDKGHAAEWAAFSDAVRSAGPPPIPFADIVASMRGALAARESLRRREPIALESLP